MENIASIDHAVQESYTCADVLSRLVKVVFITFF